MPPKQVDPLTWRVRGKASDGMIVTLGKYDTKNKAEADCERFAKEGYGDVKIDPIPQPEPEPEPESEPKSKSK